MNFTSTAKFDKIREITKQFKIFHNTSCNIGSSAAIVPNGDNNVIYASKQFLDSIHFDLTYFPLKHLGYKFVVVVISDLLAHNAIPAYISVQLNVSNRFSFADIEELMSGVRYCCEQFEIDLLQFDVGTSQQGLVATVTAMGNVEKSAMRSLSGAKENDLICVTGDLGAAYAGLLLLEREKKVFEVNPNMQPDFEGYDYLLERQLKPEPRYEVIKALKKLNIAPTAMALVSNGLAAAILHVCRASQKGCQLIEAKLPIDIVTFQALKNFNIVATTAALNGGDDYELLFTIRPSDIEKIEPLKKDVSIVGYIKEKNAGYHLITNDDKQLPLTSQEFSPIE